MSTPEQPYPSPQNPDTEYAARSVQGESTTRVEVTVQFAAETVLEVELIKGFFGLQSQADAVALAVNISALIVNEMKRGSVILTEDKGGLRSKLVVKGG